MRESRRPAAVGLLTALLMLVAGCGASPTAQDEGGTGADSQVAKKATAVYDKFNAMSGEERRKALVAAAQKEGQLAIYTSSTDEMETLAADFEDAYDIDVEVYRANSETVLQRVLQEQKANYYGNDVLETNAGELNVANKKGMLAEYTSQYRDAVRKEGQLNGWTASRFNVFVLGWNTKLLKPDEVPASLEELADPKWRGKVSMEVGDVDWFAAMYEYYKGKGMSDAEVKDLLSKIASNSKVTKGHTVQGELLAAGQFAITTSSYSHTIDKAKADGAPLEWRPAVEPIVIRPNGIGLMKTAKHPAAAMLFVDFELTHGQKVFRDAFRIGSVPTSDDPLAGLETIATPDDDLLANPEKWNTLYDEVVRNGQEVEE